MEILKVGVRFPYKEKRHFEIDTSGDVWYTYEVIIKTNFGFFDDVVWADGDASALFCAKK